MSLFKIRDKVELKENRKGWFGEVVNFYPGSQGIQLKSDGENYYGINVDGAIMILAESTLNAFFQEWRLVNEAKPEIKEKELDSLMSNQAVEVKPKRGRPKKGG